MVEFYSTTSNLEFPSILIGSIAFTVELSGLKPSLALRQKPSASTMSGYRLSRHMKMRVSLTLFTNSLYRCV
ncbi:hypothetical protein TW85_16225 [Marinomonas sp. S3726]|jgi:hypothetical protein|nr:hypothetical protein TW85_16225 [Marinomonas sp. S3726]